MSCERGFSERLGEEGGEGGGEGRAADAILKLFMVMWANYGVWGDSQLRRCT